MKNFKNLNIYFITFAAILLITYTNLYSQDFWNPTNGPDGGRILSIAEKTGILFAGTEGGGVFRSYNQGDSWESANNGIPVGEGTTGYEVYSILATSSHIFIGSSKEGRIFRSSDDGDSWESANNGIPTGAGTTAFKVYSIWNHTNGNIFIGTSK